MPQLIWLYLTALLYYRTSATCVALAEALKTVSHDRLTRLLRAEWSSTALLVAVQTWYPSRKHGGYPWTSRRVRLCCRS
jgi:hypothetical protein